MAYTENDILEESMVLWTLSSTGQTSRPHLVLQRPQSEAALPSMFSLAPTRGAYKIAPTASISNTVTPSLLLAMCSLHPHSPRLVARFRLLFPFFASSRTLETRYHCSLAETS